MQVQLTFLIVQIALLQNALCAKRVKRIVGGVTAAPPPIDDPVVFIRHFGKYARVEGLRNVDTGLYAFRGIYYADAPIGPNRFQRPSFRRLEGDINATIHGPPCPQPDPNDARRVIGDENCLLLNVFTPQMPDETTGLPVILWIHGGGFRYGSAAQYGPEPLTQNNVIFVPVQYRLGTLGVLGEGTKDFAGNLAMFDMAAALRWVQDYISFFGGDPKQIKVVGHGSGAASAMYLSNSRVPRDAISGVAAMSGSSLSQYAYDKEPVQSVKDVAEINDCPNDNETVIVKCLREKSLLQIITNDNKIQTERLAGQQMVRSLSGNVGYEPVVESEDDHRALPGIITEAPEDALKNKTFRKIPLLIGVTKHETANGLVPDEINKAFESATKFLDSVSKSLGLEKFLNIDNATGAIVTPKLPGLNAFGLTDYLKVPDDLNPEKLLEKLTEATTDALFNLPALLTAQFWGELAPSFLYSFEHTSNMSSGRKFLSGLPLVSKASQNNQKNTVAHGDELGFLFDTNDIYGNPIEDAQPTTPEDLNARKSITQLLAQFAHIKTDEDGTSKDTGIFKVFSKKGTPFIKVTSEVKLENDFRFCQMSLWGAQIEALTSISCSFLNEGLGKITGAVTGLTKDVTDVKILGINTNRRTKSEAFVQPPKTSGLGGLF